MKLKIILVLLVIFTMPLFAQKSDSTGIFIGKWGRIEYNYINYSLLIKASEISADNNAKLKAYPILLTGAEILIKYIKYDIGFSISILFGTENENLNTIPVFGLKFKSLRGGVGYILGNVQGNYTDDYHRRFCGMISFNPLDLIKSIE